MNINRRNTTGAMILFAIALMTVALTACAPGPNGMVDEPNATGDVAGFWMGLWHGFASPVMFIISLFNDSVEIFEVHNNGGWYSFGFLFGASCVLGGSGSGASKRRRRRDCD